MIESLLLNFIASRYKPFTIIFVFFVMGFADAKAWLLYESGGLRSVTVTLVIAANALILGYLLWLCLFTSQFIRPRSKAFAFAVFFFSTGFMLAYYAVGER